MHHSWRWISSLSFLAITARKRSKACQLYWFSNTQKWRSKRQPKYNCRALLTNNVCAQSVSTNTTISAKCTGQFICLNKLRFSSKQDGSTVDLEGCTVKHQSLPMNELSLIRTSNQWFHPIKGADTFVSLELLVQVMPSIYMEGRSCCCCSRPNQQIKVVHCRPCNLSIHSIHIQSSIWTEGANSPL